MIEYNRILKYKKKLFLLVKNPVDNCVMCYFFSPDTCTNRTSDLCGACTGRFKVIKVYNKEI